jgi:hypothetical protein
MYTNAKYYNGLDGKLSGIQVDINGITSFVPITPGNTDYQNIMALVAAGELTIGSAS